MCGITGFIDRSRRCGEEDLKAMSLSIRHRGPDANDQHLIHEENFKVGLAHQRLSIIDLSESGKQPMIYKQFTIVFNGEVYNYAEIKEELVKLGHSFSTKTDTEVILHAFYEWGLKCVNRFIGMFAFAVYDAERKKLFCCRDRPGVKPFYYYHKNGLFLFGSELKTISSCQYFQKEINPTGLNAYFQYGYVPTPLSIFNDTYKLEPGHWLVYDICSDSIETIKYWSIEDCYKAPKYQGTYEDAKKKMLELLNSAVDYRMVADVPVGVFLSGGYDSSLVTALLQRSQKQKIKTYTIGFNEGNDESSHAKKVANHLGTDHNELICTENEAKEMVSRIPFYFDEPFSDSSAIPTMLVSKFAREHVTVALSADGGDELFAGYGRYGVFLEHVRILNKIPRLGGLTGSVSKFVGHSLLKKYLELSKKFGSLGLALREKSLTRSSLSIFKWMNSAPYSYLTNTIKDFKSSSIPGFDIEFDYYSTLDIALCNDYYMYLQNDILTKVDRATMSYSLEGREPLLDHRLIEFAATLPDEFKITSEKSKVILKDLMHDLIPKKIMDRPKAGFSIPFEKWMKEDLSYLLDDYINEEMLSHSLLNTDEILKMVKKFKQGQFYFPTFIWRILMFQMWYVENMRDSSAK